MSIEPETISELKQAQKDMLFFIYQEEKMARDVYVTLGKIYKNETAFRAMQAAEQKHVECARVVCDIYGVDRSSFDESVIGEFESPLLTALYEAYTEKGKSSLRDALEIVECIEGAHKDMVEHASVGMPSDVVFIYEKLRKGKMGRLDSFERAIYRAA